MRRLVPTSNAHSQEDSGVFDENVLCAQGPGDGAGCVVPLLTCTYMHAPTHTCTLTCAHPPTCTCAHMRTHTHMCTHVRAPTLAHMHTLTPMCTCTHANMCARTHVQVHMHAHVRVPTPMRTHVHAYTHTHTCVYMCAHVHAQEPSSPQVRLHSVVTVVGEGAQPPPLGGRSRKAWGAQGGAPRRARLLQALQRMSCGKVLGGEGEPPLRRGPDGNRRLFSAQPNVPVVAGSEGQQAAIRHVYPRTSLLPKKRTMSPLGPGARRGKAALWRPGPGGACTCLLLTAGRGVCARACAHNVHTTHTRTLKPKSTVFSSYVAAPHCPQEQAGPV